MLARVQSYFLTGIDAHPCEVEIDINPNATNREEGDGEGRAMVVGLPDAAVKESIERVRSALVNSGFLFPQGKTLVNLAPADVKKEGPLYDLPIAVGLMMGLGVVGRGKSANGKAQRANDGKPEVTVKLGREAMAGVKRGEGAGAEGDKRHLSLTREAPLGGAGSAAVFVCGGAGAGWAGAAGARGAGDGRAGGGEGV